MLEPVQLSSQGHIGVNIGESDLLKEFKIKRRGSNDGVIDSLAEVPATVSAGDVRLHQRQPQALSCEQLIRVELRSIFS